MLDTSKLRSVRAFADERKVTGGFTEAAVRWAIFMREQNGLEASGALVRVGRRIYIDPGRFDAWIASQQRVAA